MGKKKCPACGGAMIRYGKTKAGSQRWQCPACKATSTNRIDNTAKLLQLFLSWLLSGRTQNELSVSATRRAKAAFWWCYMHSECPLPAAEILKVMPTDEDIVEVYRQSVYEPQKREGPAEWGDGLVWSEPHHSSQWRLDWD